MADEKGVFVMMKLFNMKDQERMAALREWYGMAPAMQKAREVWTGSPWRAFLAMVKAA